MRIRFVAVASILLLGGASAACGGSSPAKVTAPAKAATRIVGATTVERALVREILARMAPSPIASVQFRGSSYFGRHARPGRRMNVGVRRGRIEPLWEAEIFADTYALTARARHVPIAIFTVDGGGGSLDSELRGASLTAVASSALHDYEDMLRAAAKAADATITFRELRPGPVALATTVTTSNPAVLLKDHFAPFSMLWGQGPKGLFGFSLVIEDGTGSLAAEGACWPNGGGFIRRDLRGCTSFFSRSPPGQNEVPSCPV